jgi:hypothetical protein
MNRFPEIPRLDDELTAMASYANLFSAWEPASLQVPTLLVRAATLLPECESAEPNWQAHLAFPHDEVEVPGDHLSILADHAATTADAVDAWMVQLVSPLRL